MIYHILYHHISYSVSSYLILRIIISNTPYHHIPYSVSSYSILRIIIFHPPYHHIPYSVSSYSILRIIISHTPATPTLSSAYRSSNQHTSLSLLVMASPSNPYRKSLLMAPLHWQTPGMEPLKAFCGTLSTGSLQPSIGSKMYVFISYRITTPYSVCHFEPNHF